MENFKDFTGKNLDDAIAQACLYYDVTREQLEVEIVQDSKSGIFGLVGARKAMIRAKRATLSMTFKDTSNKSNLEKTADKRAEQKDDALAENKGHPKVEKSSKQEKKQKPASKNKPIAQEVAQEASKKTCPIVQEAPVIEEHLDKNCQCDCSSEANDDEVLAADTCIDSDTNSETYAAERVAFEQLDQDKLKEVSYDVISRLIQPIVGMVPINVSLQDARVYISLDCGDDSGLLIGREGQTLSSLQYIASRMISRLMQSSVRVQLDTGDYRTRQDEKLRELVLYLAERVRTVGRAHSTRPLSSYHRRIVHIILQDCTDLVTRSSGEGPLKRVIIQRKRG